MLNIPSWIRHALLTSLLLATLTACSPYILVITSFIAQPATIIAGGSTEPSWAFSWTVDGPLPLPNPTYTAVITPGFVDVTDVNSLFVSPTQTTIYTLTGTTGTGGFVRGEVTVTVTPANTAPVADDQSVNTPEDTPTAITLTGSDVDGDILSFVVVSGPANGTLSGTAPDLTYTPDLDFVGDDSFIFLADDGKLFSADATVSITVGGVNDAPVAVGDVYLTDEDTVLNVAAPGVLDNDSDGDGDSLTANLVTGPSNGNLTLNPDGSFDYTPNADFNGEDSFSYLANDGLEDSNEATVTITVNPVNDPPEITSNGGGPTASVIVGEGNPIVTDIEATDPDGDTEGGGGLSYSLTGGVDQGAFTIDADSGALTFDVPPDFENPTDANTDNDYEVQVTVTDSGLLTDVQDITVSVTGANDAPVVTPSGPSSSFTEDGGAVTVDGSITVSDSDDTTLASATVTITNLQDAGLEFLSATPSGAIAGGDITYAAPTLTIAPAGGAPLADFQAVLQSVTYDNTDDDPDTTDRTVRFVANDGVLNSNNGDVTVTVTPVNDPPTLTAPGAYASSGNVGIDVPAASGLLTAATIGDPDFAGPFTVGGTVPTVTSNGGTLSITTGSGAFIYSPPVGFTGADTFDYQVCDNGTPLPSECSTAQTVTINVSDMIWFIDNALVAAGNGTLATPFNTLAGFEAINGNGGSDPGAGDCIFLDTGSGNYTGGVTLENTQILVGEGASAGLASVCGVTLPTHSNSLPATSGTDPTIANAGGNGITLASGNTIRGLTVGNTSGTGISGSSFGTLTVSDASIGGSGKALDLNTGTMNSATFDSVTVTSSSSGGVSLQSLSGTTTFSSLSLTTTGGTGFLASSGGTVNITGSSNAIMNTTTGIDITNTTIGASGMTFQSIDVNGGTSPGIVLSNTGSGTFTVTGTGSTAGSGGTIENITGSDGITLNNTGGRVTFENMIIEDIADSSDASDAIGTRSGVDGIHGQDVDGGLTLDNTTMRRFSDNAINGALFSNGLSETNWDGLSILNSTIEDSNRYHVGGTGASGKGDSSDEGLVRIVGITGTVVIDNSTLQRGAELIDFFTDSGAGTLDMTVQSSSFIDSIKEFVCGNPTQNVGKAGIDVTVEGPHDAVIRIGDPAEMNAALGNTFTNNASASVRILHDAGTSGDIDGVISRNTFEVTDHLTGTNCAAGNFIFNFAQGGVLLGAGGGTYEAIVSNNLFDEVMHADGGLGQLTIIADDSGSSEFIVRGNNFQLPWDAPVRVLADGNSSAAILFDANTYTDGTLGSASDDLGVGGFPSPFTPWHLNVRNSGGLDITVQNEVLPLHDVTSGFASSFDASMNASGGTLNLWIKDSASPLGYNLVNSGAGTFELHRGLSASSVPATIIDDNNNTGGAGVDGTDPPAVTTSGTIGATNTPPTQPSISIP